MGPNDTRHVVWAIGNFSFFLCFSSLTIIFKLYLLLWRHGEIREVSDDDNGPK